MATVNLSWTAPSSVADVTNIEIYRFENQQSADTAALITLIGSASPIETLANSATSTSDASAPVGALTYCAVSKNTAGFKLESTGHADVTTT